MDDLDRFESDAFIEILAKGSSPNELHDDCFTRSDLTGVENRDDRRVHETSSGNRLGVESRSHCRVSSDMTVQDLDRHCPTEDLIIGAPDFGHSAAGDMEPQAIPAAEK
ncbi:unannotated protein [freshwater metagenome]|uniref:Unannotated protein n=1 Tax=freshwater metagenome TaxID=449393 RepID=A0A6J5YGN0_9ZZZZ